MNIFFTLDSNELKTLEKSLERLFHLNFRAERYEDCLVLLDQLNDLILVLHGDGCPNILAEEYGEICLHGYHCNQAKEV